MMKLSSMKNVLLTVDGNWRSPLAETILEKWGYDPGSVYYYRSSANFLFIFKREGENYFLRFTDAKERSMAHLESEMQILESLRYEPVKVALPVASQDGNLIELAETSAGTFYAVVFEALPGNQFEVTDLDPEDFYRWGKELGKLHNIFKVLPDDVKAERNTCREQLSSAKESLPFRETAARDELTVLQEWMETLEINEDNFGLIHYDFELDNQRWQNGEIGILDFDDCMNHWYAADIAFALRDLLKTESDLTNPNVVEFINGYQSEFSITSNMAKDLHLFIRLHNLLTFTRLLEALDVPVTELPEPLINLHSKLEAYIENYRASLQK
jgi:Ser/Thr protein kinase RdoA (MazF antagonist)